MLTSRTSNLIKIVQRGAEQEWRLCDPHDNHGSLSWRVTFQTLLVLAASFLPMPEIRSVTTNSPRPANKPQGHYGPWYILDNVNMIYVSMCACVLHRYITWRRTQLMHSRIQPPMSARSFSKGLWIHKNICCRDTHTHTKHQTKEWFHNRWIHQTETRSKP